MALSGRIAAFAALLLAHMAVIVLPVEGAAATRQVTTARCSGPPPLVVNNPSIYVAPTCRGPLVQGTFCTVSCNSLGYTGASSSNWRCYLNRSGVSLWYGTPPTCTKKTTPAPSTAVTCGALASPNTLLYDTSKCVAGTVNGGTCSIPCTSRYMGTAGKGTCTVVNGVAKWTTTLPTCTLRKCTALASSTAYTSNCTSANIGATCRATCSTGFTGTAKSYTCSSSTATSGASWLPAGAPTCTRVQCPALTNTNTQLTSTCGVGNIGATCQLSCASGFTGTAQAYTCTSITATTAAWRTTQPAPVCQATGGGTGSWVKLLPLTPWSNKAWCPGDGVTCQNNILTSTYSPNSLITVDYYTDAATITALKQRGYTVICYISGGSSESYRTDDAQLAPLRANKMSGWPEWWLDIRSDGPNYALLQQIMTNRAQLAKSVGCQAAEWDNVDCWSNNCITGQQAGSQAMYNYQLTYNRFLFTTTRQFGMAAVLKNDLDQISDLAAVTDGYCNEECVRYNECDWYYPVQGKAVLGTDYSKGSAVVCPIAVQRQWTFLVANGNNWDACPLTPSATLAGVDPTAQSPAAQPPAAPQWTEWGECSDDCNGVQYRFCGDARPNKGDVGCEGESMQRCSRPGSICSAGATDNGVPDGHNCWNIPAPANGHVWPTSVPENEIVRFWCDEGYERVGFAKYGCYGGQLSGYPSCVPKSS